MTGGEYDALARCVRAVQVRCADEARFFLEDAHAELLEALDRIVGRDGCDRFGHVVHHPREVDRGLDGGDAEGSAAAVRLGGLGGGDQRLGGHAAEVEAVAAHHGAFDQHDLETELGCPRRDHQAGRARADDADIGGQQGRHRQRALRLRSRA